MLVPPENPKMRHVVAAVTEGVGWCRTVKILEKESAEFPETTATTTIITEGGRCPTRCTRIHVLHTLCRAIFVPFFARSTCPQRDSRSPMNPVESHLRLSKSFVLSVLLSSHAKLILLSQHAESIVYQDVVEIVRESAPQLEESDVIAHAALLFESSLEPKINAMGQIILRIKPDHILGIHSVVVKAFLDAMCLRTKDEESLSVTDFKSQASISLQLHAEELARPRETDTASAITAAEQDADDWHEGTSGQTRVPSVQGEEATTHAAISQAHPQPTARPASLSLSDEFAMTFPSSAIAVAAAEVLESSSPPSAGDTDIEKSEPIVRLLAQVRKVGMDILFPQSVHDKVGRSVCYREGIIVEV